MDYKKYKNVKVIKDIDEDHAVVECKGYQFFIRKEKIDAFTVNEVFTCGYLKHLDLKEDDIVLDIGMNIGVFSVIASKHCKKIIAFEPDIDNFNIAKENLELNNITNVEIHNTAIAENSDDIELFLNSGVCSDCHSTLPIRGREKITVKAESINDVIEKHQPTKMKIDCEGEELNFMQTANLKNILGISMEVHFVYSKRNKHESYFKLLKNIEENFDEIKKPKVQDKFSKMMWAKKNIK